MKQKVIWRLALCLAIAIKLTTAADEDQVTCTRNDGKSGHCTRPGNCTKILNIIAERKNKVSRAGQLEYIRNSGGSNCFQGSVCCEFDEEDGKRQLLQQDCGKFESFKGFDGKEIKLMSRPWLSLLKFRNLKNGFIDFPCAGSLIHKRFVLTAAHCFTDKELISVRLREHSISMEEDCQHVRESRICSPPVEDIGVEQIYIHEDFNLYNDIAIVKLTREQLQKPICLPVKEELQQYGSKIKTFMLTGWGRTINSTSSDVPIETEIPLLELSKCSNTFGWEIKSTQLCIGRSDKAVCNVDSGGPLASVGLYNESPRLVQYGIVSFGSQIGAVGVPGVYTNVSSFIPWIANIIATK